MEATRAIPHTTVRTTRAHSPRTVAGIPFLVGPSADGTTRAVSRTIRFVRNPDWRGNATN
jgi:hypothetical protein